MKLNTKVVEAQWDEEKGIWHLTLEDQVNKGTWKDWCHCLINGTGILNNWKWPDIEGLHDFAGPKMHSASWDHSVDFEGKTVGVIGTGSTSVQIVPALQKEVSHLKVFMRSSTWISPPFGGGVLEEDLRKNDDGTAQPGKRQYTFTDADKKKFSEDNEYYLTFRKRIEAEINSLFGMYQQGSEMSETFRKVSLLDMMDQIRTRKS
jgi:cation diffusion facilitator CzcD-associated flavoprotein CzcO